MAQDGKCWLLKLLLYSLGSNPAGPLSLAPSRQDSDDHNLSPDSLSAFEQNSFTMPLFIPLIVFLSPKHRRWLFYSTMLCSRTSCVHPICIHPILCLHLHALFHWTNWRCETRDPVRDMESRPMIEAPSDPLKLKWEMRREPSSSWTLPCGFSEELQRSPFADKVPAIYLTPCKTRVLFNCAGKLTNMIGWVIPCIFKSLVESLHICFPSF